MSKNIIKKENFLLWIIAISLVGFALRLTGIRFEGVDYRECLSTWFYQLKEVGSLAALAEFEGDYNLPYVTAMLLLTYLPIEPLISIKMLSIAFDYLGAYVLMRMAMDCVDEDGVKENEKWKTGVIAYAVVLCLPITVINSGYLAQSDGIWAALAVLSFRQISLGHPVRGMLALGCALSMKLQAIFILPVLLIYLWKKKNNSFFHIFWVPVAIQLLSIPAVIAGCGWDIAYRVFSRMLGRYPFLYYYYPNIWTYFSEAPYYVFGKIAIILTFICLLLFAVIVINSKIKESRGNWIEYAIWIAMTCVMLLPCMHERYNYLAEILIVTYAVCRPKYRVPAVVLTVVSFQCYVQSFFHWNQISPYLLAAFNIAIYLWLTNDIWGRVFRNFRIIENRGKQQDSEIQYAEN